jgi:hypothetical protein
MIQSVVGNMLQAVSRKTVSLESFQIDSYYVIKRAIALLSHLTRDY